MNANANNEKKAYEYVFHHFYSQIMDGSLKLGDKVPTERELVEILGVSRGSVREAFHTMEMMGIIECIQGSGNYIRCQPRESLMNTISMLTILQDISLKEILDMRRCYEMAALESAMSHITETELDEMEETLTAMDHEANIDRSAQLDVHFHQILIQASRNRLLQMNVSLIGDLLDNMIQNLRTSILEDESRAALLREAHWDVLRALRAQDLTAALTAMSRHFAIDELYIEVL